MSDELTDDQIALLCEHWRGRPAHLAKGKERDLERLISGGYAERVERSAGGSILG
jgi:hypothetical protein